MAKKVVDPKFAGTKDYKKVLDVIEQKTKCPFCKGNFKYHKKPILKKGKGWFVSENTWPYKNAKHHFVIIPEKHKEEFKELSFSDFKTVSKLTDWIIKKYRVKGGAFLLRFGDSVYTGATVCHLHFHLIIPKTDKKKKKAKIVYFPIG